MRTTIGTAAVAVLVGIAGTNSLPVLRTAAAQDETKPAAAATTLLDEDARSDATAEKLKKPLDVDFIETPLADVLDFIKTKADVQFYVDARALSDIGLETSTPVSLSLKSISAEMALDLILDQLDLEYVLRSGVIIVTTPEAAERQLTVRIYSVKDLRAAPVDRAEGAAAADARRALGLLTARSQRSGLGDFGGGGFVGGDEEPLRIPLLESMVQLLEKRDSLLEQGNAEAAKKAEREFYELAHSVLRSAETQSPYDDLVGLIATSIHPESWDDVGGPGSITVFRDKLVVTNSRKVHSKIDDLLRQLRKLEHSQGEAAATATDEVPPAATNTVDE
jgi:general secretion pathway protein D